MVAEAIVREESRLRCNCTLAVSYGGQEYRVKARKWDCPSCGRDKRLRLASFAESEQSRVMLTLTLLQPVYEKGLSPAYFQLCAQRSHVYLHSSGRLLWRTLASCEHCCRRVSGMLVRLRKVLRRRWGNEFGYLTVREDMKSGELHLHLALRGVPDRLSRADRKATADAWARYGGGYINFRLSKVVQGSGGRIGWYLGKYMAKRQDEKMARGFRRWSRTANFAPDLRMGWQPPEPDAQVLIADRASVPSDRASVPSERQFIGWQHPLLPVVCARRVWVEHGAQVDAPAGAPPVPIPLLT